MSTQLPALLHGLVDDAAVFPPGSSPLPEAVVAHRTHRACWYADLVGPLLVPASRLGELADQLKPDESLVVGLIGDVPLAHLDGVLADADPRIAIRQVEAAVAKRGEDPLPGLAELVALARRDTAAPAGPVDPVTRIGPVDPVTPVGPVAGARTVYAELPLTFGLAAALDVLAEARAQGVPIAAKFRTGGLAAELFPTPAELAAVICACRDRGVPFKLTAGLHHAVRHQDPETGFTHHGVVNVLAATLAAAEGAGRARVAELLTATDPRPLLQQVPAGAQGVRPLWVGFGSCSILEPLTDLIRLGLVNGGFEA